MSLSAIIAKLRSSGPEPEVSTSVPIGTYICTLRFAPDACFVRLVVEIRLGDWRVHEASPNVSANDLFKGVHIYGV